ncbi:hypothetical protein P4493_04560 [Bacillus thuringiensis]|jgi:hypothetical protein|uniref:Membrane protein n=2 Tax=Bacillus thuringiensis TaxID=1428 RepID=A0A0B5NL47_BACTU|nr:MULTISPECIES: hypothetical protein [Bacillus]MEC2535149.1 hypothetical protein [Bacillus cereus]MED1153736.1 hypothetical protein [Bacillus paranthracis]OUB09393.1 hypothetical protein BK708_33270 [Bacillus thuringiensis serovar yunnanensis]AJG74097.1 putative membrane protein [Bacillus thuringiensis]AJH02938.1 putative membrane protein [Bacillus thuringiensis HD1002]
MGFLTDFIILSVVPSIALLLTKKFPMKLRIVSVIIWVIIVCILLNTEAYKVDGCLKGCK